MTANTRMGSTSGPRLLHVRRGIVCGMWTHQTQRLVPRPLADVRDDIALIVDATWRHVTDVTTTVHHGRRSDWITIGPDADEVDIVLTWSLSDVDGDTLVVLTLDEFERGPDPLEGLEEILDVLSVVRRPAQS
jgi:hypothetical protein